MLGTWWKIASVKHKGSGSAFCEVWREEGQPRASCLSAHFKKFADLINRVPSRGIFYLAQEFPTLALLTFQAGSCFVIGGCPALCRFLAASWASVSTCVLSTKSSPSPDVQPQIPPDIANVPWEAKSFLVVNCCF